MPMGDRLRDAATVLVLDGQTMQGLACVRSLGRAGLRVLVASHWPIQLAAWSRYAAGSYRLRAESLPEFARLRAWARHRGVDVVIPGREPSCRLINTERAAWEAAGMIVGCADDPLLLRAFDKAETLRIAAAAGVRVPPTALPRSIEESRDAAAKLGYPLVVKSPFSSAWDGRHFQHGGGTSYVATPAQLDSAVARHRQGARWPILQAFVPGQGVGVTTVYDHGRAVAWFAHERLRDVRPSGSGSALRRATPLTPRIRDAAERLLGAMEWHGPAMVEFRDDGGPMPYLMEVNGRFWGSLQLAISAGVDMPYLWYRILRGEPLGPVPEYRTDTVVRWLWGDAKRLLYVMRGPAAGYPGTYPSRLTGLREVLGRQPAGTQIETWDSDDPMPALGEWAQGAYELLHTVAARFGSRSHQEEPVTISGSPVIAPPVIPEPHPTASTGTKTA